MYLYNNIKITGAWKNDDGRSIPRGWVDGATPAQLLDYDVEVVADPVVPNYDTETQRLTTLPNGQYEIIDFTQAELDARKVQSVSMRQARLALLGTGILGQVQPFIDSLLTPEKEAAQIEWEYSTSVERTSPLVIGLVASLGLSDEDLDNLFQSASEL